jgi:hypothetical protein
MRVELHVALSIGNANFSEVYRSGKLTIAVRNIVSVLTQETFCFRAELDRERPVVIPSRRQTFLLPVVHLFAAPPKPQLQFGPVGALD